MTAPARPAGPGPAVHFRALDGYRALAALVIVVAHAVILLGHVDRIPTLDANRFSFLGVAMFFTLSGFLLYRPFVRAHLADRPMMPVKTFLRRRLLRIFPLYWVVLTAYLLIRESSGISGFVDHVKMYLLLQIYDPTLYAKGIAAAWTLCVELTFYLALPLLALGARRLAHRWPNDPRAAFRAESIVIAAFFMLGPVWRIAWSVTGPHASVAFPNGAGQLVDIWLPAQADLFALGMALALVHAATTARRRPVPSLLAVMARRPSICLAVGVMAVALLDVVAIPIAGTALTPEEQAMRYAVYVIVCGLLIAPMVFGDGRSLQARFLGSGPMHHLSDLSYGLYLWHLIILLEVSRWLGGEDVAPFWPTLTIGLAISLTLAFIGYHLVEQPMLRFRDDHGATSTRRREPETSTPVPTNR